MGWEVTHNAKTGRPSYWVIGEDGKKERVPSVTTVCKAAPQDPGGLLFWANSAGLEGLTLEEARQTATDVGTVAHSMIEAFVRGQPLDLAGIAADTVEKATRAFEQWRRWAEVVGYTPVENELSLVSEKYKFGGTMDAVHIMGTMCLVDWKTSKGIYKDHLLQVAAYGHLWNSARPDTPVQRYQLLRLGKDDPSFSYHEWDAESDAIKVAWRQFVRARAAYEDDRWLKKVV